MVLRTIVVLAVLTSHARQPHRSPLAACEELTQLHYERKSITPCTRGWTIGLRTRSPHTRRGRGSRAPCRRSRALTQRLSRKSLVVVLSGAPWLSHVVGGDWPRTHRWGRRGPATGRGRCPIHFRRLPGSRAQPFHPAPQSLRMAPCSRMDRRRTRGVAEQDLEADGRGRRDDRRSPRGLWVGRDERGPGRDRLLGQT